jgi:hypothetical protein
MTPLAHHIGEESLVNLLVLSGGGLSLIAAASRAHLAKALARLTRRVSPKWVSDRRRSTTG